MSNDELSRQRDRRASRANSVRCIECGQRSVGRWRGWRACMVRDPDGDDPPQLAFYCWICAEREFGASASKDR